MTLMPTDVLFPPLPPGYDYDQFADTDWATGLIRVFASHAEWARLISSDPAGFDEEELLTYEALTHEMTHRLQLLTTGFGYELSRQWFYIVASAARDCPDLDAVNAAREKYLPPIQQILNSLTRTGEHGISPLGIMEGLAFYAQVTSHRKVWGPGGKHADIDPASFDDILNEEAPSEVYRIAYDVAVQYLAEEAFDKFPHVANLALFTSEPETVFVPLLEEFRRGASRMGIDRNHEMGIAFLRREYGHIFLGAADEISGLLHPVLDPVIGTLAELREAGTFHPLTLLARSQVTSDDVAKAIYGPLLFTPDSTGPDRIAPMIWPGRDPSEASENPLLDPPVMRMLAATSQLLLQDTDPLPDQDAGNRLTIHSGVSAGIHMWRFAARDRTAETVERIGNLLDRLEDNSAKARSLRGSVAIVFPAGEFPGTTAPLLDAGVQDFIRLLFVRVPYLLYYLIDEPGNTSILECMAAFAPKTLSISPQGELKAEWTPESAKIIATLLRNAMAFAAMQGQPGTVVIEKLGRLPPQAQLDVISFLMPAHGRDSSKLD